MSLGSAIAYVFGCEAGQLLDPADIRRRSLAYDRGSWHGDDSGIDRIARYLDRADVFDAVCEQASREWPEGCDLFHMLCDALLASVPFPHGCFVVEVAEPHPLWLCSESQWTRETPSLFWGWSRGAGPDVSLFEAKCRRARWLARLLPAREDLDESARSEDDAQGRVQAAVAAWADDGRPDAKRILDAYLGAPETCGSALGALWGSFFLGTGAETAVLADRLVEHRSAAVRSAVACARAIERGATDGIHAILCAQRERFLDARAHL